MSGCLNTLASMDLRLGVVNRVTKVTKTSTYRSTLGKYVFPLVALLSVQ